MIDVKLYKTNSPRNKIGKTLTSIGTYSCALKENTSILRPVLIIGTSDSLYTANYLQIETFGRKYFIEDIKSIGNGRWEVSAHVDVLDTYANQILNNRAVVSRQQNLYNLYLNDPDFRTYNNDRIQTVPFSTSDFSKTLTYVLVVNGS
jgi:hypothetical protein